MSDDTPPRRLYLQWYGDPDDEYAPIGHDRPEGVTFYYERVYRNDLCYIRAGRHTSEALREQDEEIAALRARVAELEAQNAILRSAALDSAMSSPHLKTSASEDLAPDVTFTPFPMSPHYAAATRAMSSDDEEE